MFNRTFRGRVTPEDKARNDYFYVPFELPAPARRLTVRYHYSARMHHGQREGGNVIDIGLFGPEGAHFPGGAGFRGWSGSDRLTFTVGREEATPGYLPGPLPAGRYQVILGLYRIWAEGADYEIEVQAELAETAGDAAWAGPRVDVDRLEPAPDDGGEEWLWLKGDLQSHTYHSDGKGSPAYLASKARALGLDFLAITDHNTVSHHAALAELSDEQLLLIPGQEVTTYYGHMNVWGASRWCDFRCRSDEEMAALIALAHAHGGLCSINHPKEGGPAWTYGLDLPVDALEVWQGPWPHRNEESLALWERLLNEGRRVPVVGGSDYHCPSESQGRSGETGFLRLGQPTTWVRARGRDAGAVLEAILAGRTSISALPDGPRLDLRAGAGGKGDVVQMGQALRLDAGREARVTVEAVGGDGLILRLATEAGVAHEEKVQGAAQRVVVTLPAERYIRAELVGDMAAEDLPPQAPADLDLRGWRWALTNPIYID